MRIDLLLDMTAQPGLHFRVIDKFYRGLEYRLLDLVYADSATLRDLSQAKPVRLPTIRCPSQASRMPSATKSSSVAE
jgi:hypothetical protein